MSRTDGNFELTVDHVKLLGRAYIRWDNCEYGAPGLDPKRPFGNSDVEGDVCEILGWTPDGDDGGGPCWSSAQRHHAASIYAGIGTALQVVLVCRSFEPGRYFRMEEYDDTSWKRVV